MARIRSPNYPAISLPEAIARAKTIYAAEQHLAAPREVIAKHLGFTGVNGGSNRIISALAKYGLLEEVSGDKVRVSALARSILHPTNDLEKVAAITEAATKPVIFGEIANEWGGATPSDANLRNWLRRKNFAEDAIERVIQAFSETMELATPSGGDYNTPESKLGGSVVPQKVKLGDYVQWEQSGVLQFPTAKKVTWLSEDGQWLRVEGSQTGIPALEVHITDAPKKPPGDFFTQMMEDFLGPIGPKPLSERLQVTSTGNQLRVAAVLFDAKEVERLVRILNANKELLADPDTPIAAEPEEEL